MPKLRLNAEMLAVESFAADEQAAAPRGTVDAHSYVTVGAPTGACGGAVSRDCVETEFHWNTCGNSCINKCYYTVVEAGCIE